MQRVNGIHHITAIAGPAQENLDFYAGVLGMRLVKKSVNQDDPGTYHLFYADAEGHPGTDLTFCPWSHAAPPSPGHGLAVEVGLEVPRASLEYWSARLAKYGVKPGTPETRFGERSLPFTDPHGLGVALVESAAAGSRRFQPWEESPVPPERQIHGLHGARLWERELARTTSFLESVLGFRRLGTEAGWTRYGLEGAPGGVDIAERPDTPRGAWGVGTVHHLYFLEPGGVLFELATDGPGFAVDEDRAHLGESLVLPPFLEHLRGNIESVLPSLRPAAPAGLSR